MDGQAYKLKHAVTFPYLDFSTTQMRRAACEAEVRLNRRAAPCLYLGVMPVSRGTSGGFLLNNSRDPVEWLVETTRLGQDVLFDFLAEKNQLDRPVMEDLAEQIFTFHDREKSVTGLDGAGIVRSIIENNNQCLTEFAEGVLEQALVERDRDITTGRALDYLEA